MTKHRYDYIRNPAYEQHIDSKGKIDRYGYDRSCYDLLDHGTPPGERADRVMARCLTIDDARALAHALNNQKENT